MEKQKNPFLFYVHLHRQVYKYQPIKQRMTCYPIPDHVYAKSQWDQRSGILQLTLSLFCQTDHKQLALHRETQP